MINYGLRVVLDRIDVVDPAQLLMWRNDFRIYRTCRQRDVLTLGEHLKWFDRVSNHMDPSIKMYTVFRNNPPTALGSKPIGICGLTNIDYINRRAEFSLYVEPSSQNLGLGKDALKTLVSHGFNTYGFESIWGESYEGNGALEMFKEIGFALEGIRRNFYYREGKFIDALLFSILRKDWETSVVYNDARKQIACFT
jgi:RimJ/RimL family protein N-acetyltransferase